MTSYSIKLGLTLLLTLGFIAVVEHFIGFRNIFNAWQKLETGQLLLALLLMLGSYCLRAMRLFSYFPIQHLRNFVICVRISLLHNFFNNLLPMRSGEISLPLMLKQYFAIPGMRAVAALLLFRILDLHVLGLILLATSLVLFPGLSLGIVMLLLLWLTIPWLVWKFHARLAQNLGNKTHNKWASRLLQFMESFPRDLSRLLTAYGWTFINWLVKLWVLSWILLQFYNMPASTALTSVIFGDASSVLPIHGVAGIGTYEAGVVLGGGLLGENARNILPAAINLHLFVLGASALAALVALLLPRQAVSKPSGKR